MDQAKTLRKMLGLNRPMIAPILGDMSVDYAAILGRLVLEQHAKNQHTALLFDGSSHTTSDLLLFFQRRAHLEDLVVELSKNQYWVPSRKGLEALSNNPNQADALLGGLHRLPVTCEHFYATLPHDSWRLAAQIAPSTEWFWVVQPTAQSVTQVFQGIRNSCGVDENRQHRVIVGGVRDTDEADHVFSNLLDTTLRFVAKPLQYAGHLPELSAGKSLNPISREMISAGRRVAKLICSLEEHALMP